MLGPVRDQPGFDLKWTSSMHQLLRTMFAMPHMIFKVILGNAMLHRLLSYILCNNIPESILIPFFSTQSTLTKALASN